MSLLQRDIESDSPHPIISRPSTGAENHCEFRYLSTRDSCNKLCSIFRYSTFLGVGADHEATDILKKDERDITLRAELNEMCALESRFGEEDAVVGNDAHLMTIDVCEACIFA